MTNIWIWIEYMESRMEMVWSVWEWDGACESEMERKRSQIDNLCIRRCRNEIFKSRYKRDLLIGIYAFYKNINGFCLFVFTSFLVIPFF